jgi:methionyl-tRNA formyltransferase
MKPDLSSSGHPKGRLTKDRLSLGRYTVAILFDPDNDWLYKHTCDADLFDSMASKYTFSLHYDPSEIRDCDIVFILGYTKILNADFLNANRLPLVIHESALPKGKGFSPIQWQILEGKNEIQVCLIHATADLDAGDILERALIRLKGHELFIDIRRKQAETTLLLMERILKKYPHFSRIPQTGRASFYRRRTRKDDRLDVHKSIAEQFNALRIADNRDHPAYFVHNGNTYYLKVYRSPDGKADDHQ